MRHFIIATHGSLADGYQSAIEMIMGHQSHLTVVPYFDDEQDLAQCIKDLIKGLTGEIIILTDLYGGSVNHQLLPLIHEQNIHLISGINLALVIELLMLSDKQDFKSQIHSMIDKSRKGMIYCNDYETQIILDDFEVIV